MIDSGWTEVGNFRVRFRGMNWLFVWQLYGSCWAWNVCFKGDRIKSGECKSRYGAMDGALRAAKRLEKEAEWAERR